MPGSAKRTVRAGRWGHAGRARGEDGGEGDEEDDAEAHEPELAPPEAPEDGVTTAERLPSSSRQELDAPRRVRRWSRQSRALIPGRRVKERPMLAGGDISALASLPRRPGFHALLRRGRARREGDLVGDAGACFMRS